MSRPSARVYTYVGPRCFLFFLLYLALEACIPNERVQRYRVPFPISSCFTRSTGNVATFLSVSVMTLPCREDNAGARDFSLSPKELSASSARKIEAN